jgi:hypothetical protein
LFWNFFGWHTLFALPFLGFFWVVTISIQVDAT